jgi:hypothetical protein
MKILEGCLKLLLAHLKNNKKFSITNISFGDQVYCIFIGCRGKFELQQPRNSQIPQNFPQMRPANHCEMFVAGICTQCFAFCALNFVSVESGARKPDKGSC